MLLRGSKGSSRRRTRMPSVPPTQWHRNRTSGYGSCSPRAHFPPSNPGAIRPSLRSRLTTAAYSKPPRDRTLQGSRRSRQNVHSFPAGRYTGAVIAPEIVPLFPRDCHLLRQWSRPLNRTSDGHKPSSGPSSVTYGMALLELIVRSFVSNARRSKEAIVSRRDPTDQTCGFKSRE